MRKSRHLVLLLFWVATVFSLAQIPGDRAGVPQWEIDTEFSKDVFTFIRIRYSTGGRHNNYYRGGGDWRTDHPDAELNLSYRLQQMTSLKVNPEGRVLELTDKDLFHYPFIYIVEPGDLLFTEEEVKALRHYLLNGGFLMVDDFWGEDEWDNFYQQIKRVFGEREPVELPVEHPIFHCVFDLKEKPQMPSIHHVYRARGTPYETYERRDAREVHFKAIYDDKGRMMVIICHNTDLGAAGNVRVKTNTISVSTQRKRRIQWGSTLSFTR